ncbi:MAG: Uma2 family endonuclease [Caldilineaceae bacterium]
MVIEIVSNDDGGEDTTKKAKYAELGILYYAIFDPYHELTKETFRFFRLVDGEYIETKDTWMPEVELGLTLWQGRYQEVETTWLRWCDQDGNLIPTGEELAEQERARAERLAAKLLELGLSADEVDNL